MTTNCRPRHYTSRTVALCLAFFLLCAAWIPHASAADPGAVRTSGSLPVNGTVVIRSGLAWLNESSPVFRKVCVVLARELKARGLTVVSVTPSKLLPMPETTLPPKKNAVPERPSARNDAAGSEAAQKAGELAHKGKLPQLKLRGYSIPEKDSDLPPQVVAIAPPDVTRGLFARSQVQGRPEVTSFAVPGRLPEELAADAEIAEYAVIVTFAAVRASAARQEGDALFPGGPPGVAVAAATVQGVGRLGFGTSTPSSSGKSAYGTPGGFVRGYESPAGPNDPWHRDYDFYQRDYQFKHGPEPQYAKPPKDFAPTSRTAPRQALPPVRFDSGRIAAHGWYLLLLDGFNLVPMREGKKPERIWWAASRLPAEDESLETALPKLARAVFAVAGQ